MADLIHRKGDLYAGEGLHGGGFQPSLRPPEAAGTGAVPAGIRKSAPRRRSAALRKIWDSRFCTMVGIDVLVFVSSCILATLLRFEFELPPRGVTQIVELLSCLVVTKVVTFHLFGMYKGMWRFSSLSEFWMLAQACILSVLCTIVVLLLLGGLHKIPRSIFVIDAVLTFVLAGSVRMLIRSYFAVKSGSRIIHSSCTVPGRRAAERVLIIGAGASGEKLLRTIIENPNIVYHVVGFLDDDSGKHGRALLGIPVFGPVKDLGRVVRKYGVESVFISIPSASGTQMRNIVETCKECCISYKTLPAIGEIMEGKISVKKLRDVNYEDLLRRKPVRLDNEWIREYLEDRVVLVTGAGGSIGSELCRQLVRFNPEKLVLVDAGEENLYGIQMELRHEVNFQKFCCILASVQDRKLLEAVFAKYRPAVVFHAAAYKHVPLLERNPWEAVYNNVMGSRVVMGLAAGYGVGRFVLVSTDKAVRPTNVMGASKRLSEIIMQSIGRNGTRFMAVRFGNVVGSSGSVIPLFRKQIEHGGPVTVTHPEVTRYFMTIPEAAQLILQAGAMGSGGEVFVLEMGTPIRIDDMARDFIRLSGKEPGRDIEIVYSGLRPGEKLYEELITCDEDVTGTVHEKIMVLRANGNGSKAPADPAAKEARLDRELDDLCRIARTHDPAAIKRKFRQMVPEYTPQETDCVLEEPGCHKLLMEQETMEPGKIRHV